MSLPDKITNRTVYAAIAAATAAGAACFVFGSKVLVPLLLSVLLLVLGQPLFRAYAMARPNARSSHKTPVPQGGGAPVVAATLICAMLFSVGPMPDHLLALVVSACLLAIVGAVDDVKGLPVVPRLGAQFAAVALFIMLAPLSWRLFPEWMPLLVERTLLVVAGVWFVNLTNFMDGIDGITIAAFLPMSAAVFLFSQQSYASAGGATVAMCFAGALIGFIVFNWHPARLFLGDVGSLPIGLIGGALVFDVAAHGGMAAAIILPLYHFTDATFTLLRRLLRREPVWEAHRQHAYQNAVDAGHSHNTVSGVVLALNTVLAIVAWFSLGKSLAVQASCVLFAAALVAAVIMAFHKAGVRQ
ncbi:MAG: MraY family glycosyltransferase [Beijerinckiaceae bacterium]